MSQSSSIDTARRLRQAIPTILERWEKSVREQVPPARDENPVVLRDSAPPFLEEIAASIERGETAGPQRAREVMATAHGEQRAYETDYSLDDVLMEYCLLRKSVLSVLEEAGPLCADHRDIVLDAVEEAMREAGVEFAQRQQERLRDADRSKNEFMAMLAHELRTPLSAVTNAVQLLDHIGSLEEPAACQRAVIARQVKAMVRLVDDLLDLSRVLSGQIEVRRERTDLRTVVGDALAATRPQFDARRQHLAVDLPPEPVWLHADPIRLGQVFINLLSNASRYTDPGGEILLRMETTAGDAVVRIRDSGIGIRPEMLPRIFALFERDPFAADRASEGLGLGLALVKRLVELHEGQVSARSAGPGKAASSSFNYRLRRRRVSLTM